MLLKLMETVTEGGIYFQMTQIGISEPKLGFIFLIFSPCFILNSKKMTRI